MDHKYRRIGTLVGDYNHSQGDLETYWVSVGK
jgi:hypothetical protein